MCNKCGID